MIALVGVLIILVGVIDTLFVLRRGSVGNRHSTEPSTAQPNEPSNEQTMRYKVGMGLIGMGTLIVTIALIR